MQWQAFVRRERFTEPVPAFSVVVGTVAVFSAAGVLRPGHRAKGSFGLATGRTLAALRTRPASGCLGQLTRNKETLQIGG